MRRMQADAGVSLLEAVLAMAILSAGTVSLLMAITLSRSSEKTQDRSARVIADLASSAEAVRAAPFVPCVPGNEAAAVGAYRSSLQAAGLASADAEVVEVWSWDHGTYVDAAHCPPGDSLQRVTVQIGGGRTIDLVKRAG